jgi:hypothetical protein
MFLFSINRSRGYENPSLDIIVIDLCSAGGCPFEEAREHCFQIQSAISVVILISFQCYCGECSGYIAVILPLLTFYFCSEYILYLVYDTFPHESSALEAMISTLGYHLPFSRSLPSLFVPYVLSPGFPAGDVQGYSVTPQWNVVSP